MLNNTQTLDNVSVLSSHNKTLTKRKIKAIIFDMDGVLIDAKDWHYEALNKALALFGQEINRQEHLSKYDGLPTKDKLLMLNQHKGLCPLLNSFINEMKQKYTIEAIHKYCKPQFQHEYALSCLTKERYKLALASNSIRNTINLMMQKAHLNQYFNFFISNEDVTQGKPDPEMYNKTISLLGLMPSECVIVEDNENGIRAAKASKANVLEVKTVYDVNYENIKQFISKIEG